MRWDLVMAFSLSAFLVGATRFSWRVSRARGGTFMRSLLVAPIIAVLALAVVPVWAAEQIVDYMTGRGRP